MTLDIMDGDVSLSNNIKFLFILICFCYALFSIKGVSRNFFLGQDRPYKIFRQHQLLAIMALLFTVISDLFILILDYYLYGVITFIIVQQLYGIRLNLFRQSTRIKTILQLLSIQAMFALIIAFILLLLKVEIDVLLIASIFYFICILMNVVRAIRLALTEHSILFRDNLIVFALGMVLFLLCDINVGLFNMAGYVPMPDNIYMKLYQASSLLMWGFYAPSQLLISLSISSSKMNKKS